MPDARNRMIVANLVLLLLLFISFLPFSTETLGRLGITPVATVYFGIVISLTALAYAATYAQVLAAHPSSGRPFTPWNLVGPMLYPTATVVGYFVPLLGVALNVRWCVIRPTNGKI